MRALGFCASLLAAGQIVLASSPALAASQADASASPAKPAAATVRKASKKPAKPAAKKPKNAAPAPEAAAEPVAPAAAAPAPVATPAPAPLPAPAPAATTTLTSAEVDTKRAEAPVKTEDGQVDVHIESPRAVRLERHTTDGTWETVCTSPCDQKVGVTPEYRLAGDELNESIPFHLDGSKGRVNLVADPGVRSKRTTGAIVGLSGAAVALGGAAVILFGMKRSGDATGELSQPRNDAALLAGGTMIFAGLVGGIVGASWFANNGHTGASGDITREIQEKNGPVPGDPKTTKRAPEPSQAPKMTAFPGATTFPLVSGAF